MALDSTSLQKALATLDIGLQANQSHPNDALIREACILRFQYCLELTHKTLRRYLETTEPTSADVNLMSLPNSIRLGYERGLVKAEYAVCNTFRNSRNITSHGYDETNALKVLSVIPDFLDEAKFFLSGLEAKKNDY